ncbi:MAG TPA: flagellar hook basal-body protein, partial [Phycisphaerae bacterium]|nr:flagellar hook basal-body protein [Phycisphaerae bacterium]
MYGENSAAQPGKIPLENMAVDFSQGMLNHTGRNMDLAISGKGFFSVETTKGTLYTRGGSFQLDQNRRLVDASGRNIAGISGPVTIPPGVDLRSISITPEGSLSSKGQNFGKLKITEFENDSLLLPVGESCFQADENAQISDTTNSQVNQGYLEKSNVSMVEELVDLIAVSRLYEANVKIAKSQDQSTENIIRLAMS